MYGLADPCRVKGFMVLPKGAGSYPQLLKLYYSLATGAAGLSQTKAMDDQIHHHSCTPFGKPNYYDASVQPACSSEGIIIRGACAKQKATVNQPAMHAINSVLRQFQGIGLF